MTKSLSLRAALAAALLSPAASQAQELTGEVTLYGWLPSISGTVRTPNFKRSAETSGDGILDALQFAFMATGELRYGSWGFLADIVYSKTSAGGELAGPFKAETNVQNKLLLLSGAATYRIHEWENGAWIDALAGLRYAASDVTIEANGTGPLGVTRRDSASEGWLDPLLGLRGRMPLGAGFGLTALADVGGFGVGSDLTWELYAGLDYAITERFVAKLGYRFLSIDYSNDGASLDIDVYGPALGLAVRF